ncbi:DUF2057 family protein [uncultured Succinatimonas sp.]|uniref:DUF2057 family protein n=1 Tax=uncultured Succinatimonas sp. TaxID=1262973 RepID=UPI0025CD87B6|nr:DUF2057 family protein [uncultured Succinatimonas sp.]
MISKKMLRLAHSKTREKQMTNFNSFLKIGVTACALTFAANAFADAQFKVPTYYSIELVDGSTNQYDYSRFNRTITLSPGRHQIVLLFEGQFGSMSEGRMIEAADPIVVEISDIQDGETYTFKYDIPRDENQASKFARAQKIQLTDLDGNAIPESKASYYILTSESGFAILRDYRQDLMSLNRLYAPNYVEGSKRGIGMTAYGSPTIQANASGNILNSGAAHSNMAMAAPEISYEQESNLATSSVNGGAVNRGSAAFRQLVKMYESADDKTKLEFVKYVMSH